MLVLDAAENWFDGYGLSPDSRPSWFVEAVRGIGNLLGIGNLFELPEGVGAGGSSPDEVNATSFSEQFFPDLPNEPEFLSQSDVTLGQALHRPESSDVDFYSFEVVENGRVTAETFAQRLHGSSLLDTHINLYRVVDASAGEYELIARNDDFFSDDSFVGIDVTPGSYVIGVSASGNEDYNGNVSGSGLGGKTEGRYEMRVTFTASAGSTISDTNGTELDGDADGQAGGEFNFWFRTARDLSDAVLGQARTIFVAKDGDDLDNGGLASPVRTISHAFSIANEGDVVRLLPSAGSDGLISTTDDNLAYEIGFGGTGSGPLADGSVFEVPRGVTVMIDAGSILKLRTAKISVGSETFDEDRSLAALQILGTPVIVEANPAGGDPVIGTGEVFFTSYDDESLGVDTNLLSTTPIPGNWAGIEFRNDFDYTEGRPVWETEGIFLDYSSHANMRYGGGSIAVDQPIVTPLQMRESRPTLIYNTITNSADAAISADPNSFLETNFHSPVFQRVESFTSDYDRVGPEISGNRIFDNSINGLFIRVNTPAAGQLEPMTVSGRLDDADITHVLSQVLVLQGQPGGPLLLQDRPDVSNVTLASAAGGDLDATEAYRYRLTFVTTEGSESLASVMTAATPASVSGTHSIELGSLPPALDGFVGRRLYRSVPGTNDFEFVTQLDRATEEFVDDGTTRGGLLLAEVQPVASGVGLSESTSGGALIEDIAYDYRFTFVDDADGETTPSEPTSMIVAPATGAIELTNLPAVPDDFQSLRVYRLDPATGRYNLFAQLLPSETSVTDTGLVVDGFQLPDNESSLLLPRFDARLSVDPGLIVKLQSARIEAGFGADFYAEADDGRGIVFTSRLDDTYGAGGTFDTNNDGIANNAAPGDWGGLVFRQDATASLDFAQVRFGGGTTSTGGGFTEFNAIEILQADVRIANSTISRNASGFQTQSIRDGIGFNEDAAIFVRGSQPIIVENTIVDNDGAAISINPDALNHDDVLDHGRSTGPVDLINSDLSNQGPLFAGNMMTRNDVNGLRVRSELLTGESVWDDTDIVHVVDGEITSATHHFRGGLRLKSDADRSLVVKFTEDSTLVGTGRPLDIDDRIGGTLQVLGTPGNPVVLTSVNDCSIGAGFTPDGRPNNDTTGSGACSAPTAVPESIDVVILLDDTGSFSVAGATLATVFPQLVDELTQSLPGADLAFGIARFEDYSTDSGDFGFGDPNDRPFVLNQPVIRTTDPNFDAAIDAALNRSSPGFGGDGPESAIEALWQIATGLGFDGNGDGDTTDSGDAGLVATQTSPGDGGDVPAFSTFTEDATGPVVAPAGTLGGVGFRADSQEKIIILATDIGFQYEDDGLTEYVGINGDVVPATVFAASGRLDSPGGRGATIQETVDRLIRDGITVVGLGTGPLSQTPLEGLATLTGAVDSAGNPLYFDVEPDNAPQISLGISSAITGSVENPGEPGDWQGIRLESYVNDRNVGYVIETERAIAAAAGENAIADNAQLVGNLADHEFAGDETERLGFNIRGTLSSPSDQDVYRFDARGGTSVFIDIDDTTFGLDTVVELIDVNDQVLASSDNSFDEANGSATLISTLPDGTVRPLYQLGIGSVESPNALDAGFQVVLPGSSAQDNRYYVRVRTASGETQGQYQLSLRLRETDEIAGSTIQMADIRFATDAITVSGAPLHSPLTGDATESLDFSTIIDPTPGDPNNNDEYVRESADNFLTFTPGQADRIGNVLTSDRGSLVVTGTIGNVDPANSPNAGRISSSADIRLEDVDVYQVDLYAQQIEPDVFDSEVRFVTTTFDVDYADGLGRVNTSIAVYASNGELILHSRDSNISDDTGRPTLGVDSDNLSAGSAGVLDAHIGPVELPEGTYFVVVSNASVVPEPIDQFFNPESDNPNVRLMPINSVRRIADDSLDEYDIATYDPEFPSFFSDSLNYTAERPILEPVFDQNSIVPYTLDDIRLFVSLDGAISGNNNTILASFNPFTGTMERLIGQSADPTDDLALRSDGELFTYTLGPATGMENNNNVGQLELLSPVDGSATDRGDDGIIFQSSNAGFTNTANDNAAQLDVHAIAFPLVDGSTIRTTPITNVNTPGFLVGSRDNNGRGFEIPFELTQNIFYQFSAVDGQISSRGSRMGNAERQFNTNVPYNTTMGPASTEVEWGIVDTGRIFDSGGDGGRITGIALDPEDFTGQTVFAATDLGGIHRFNYTDNVAAPETSVAFGYDMVIPTNFMGVIPVDPDHFAETFATTVRFSGATLGPRTIEDEAYRQILFATTTDGWMYAIDVSGAEAELAPVFYGGRSAIPLTFQSGLPVTLASFGTGIDNVPHGLAFSHLEASPWHQTSDRGATLEHGIQIPHDQSRIGVLGSSSLYYGFEVTANQAQNTISRDDGNNLGELAPGGSHGSIISRPFNLEGYSAADKPTLYFTYNIEVEDDDDYNRNPADGMIRLQNDSFRVFGSGDDGQWQLLATNNDYRELAFLDEYDNFPATGIPVQEIFDVEANTPEGDQNWRQARVDISPLAGSENVRIRFDFSTAGSMRTHFGSVDFTAVNADDIEDHQRVTLTDNNGNQIEFQNIIGLDLAVPAGDDIQPGESIQIDGPEGPFVVTFVSDEPAAPGEVQVDDTMNSRQVAQEVLSVLPFSLQPVLNAGNRISLLAATNITHLSDVPAGRSSPVQVFSTGFTGESSQIVVPAGSGLFAGEQISLFSATAPPVVLTFVDVDSGDPNEVFFTPADTVDEVAANVLARIPAQFGAVYEGDGVITFINDTLVNITPSASAIAITDPFATVENRFDLRMPNGNNLVDGETLTFDSPAGTTVVTFVETMEPSGPGQVSFQGGDSPAEIAERLWSVLPADVGAYSTGNLVSVTATSVVSDTATTNIMIDPVVFSQDVVHIDVPDGVQLRNGEQLTVSLGFFQTEVITFVEIGQSVPDTGTAQVFYTDLDTAADLYDDILAALPIEMQAYIDPNIGGINVAAFGASAAVTFDPLSVNQDVRVVNESAIPITIPRGMDIQPNETLVVSTKDDLSGINTQTLTFVPVGTGTGAAGEIEYDPDDTAADVALDVLAQLPIDLQGFLVGTRELRLMNALSVRSETESLFVAYESPEANLIPIITDDNMPSTEVVDRVRAAFAEGFGRHVADETNGVSGVDDFKVYGGDRIRLYNVTVDDQGPFGLSQYDVISGGAFTTTSVPGDEFGEDQPAFVGTTEIRQRGAQNNEVEGVYIDDIIIGFAERGEMVLNAPNNERDFVFNPETLPDSHPDAVQPERQNEVTVGEYTLEIRTSDEYGVPQDYDPVNLVLFEQASIGRSFDTNDRLADGAVTLIAPGGSDLLDGDLFVLDDGSRQLTFEFDNINDGNVASGNVQVTFDPSDHEPAAVADAIRDAINTQFEAELLDITAGTGDSLEVNNSTGGRVELYGGTISVNPSSGRFIKVDLVDEETYLGRETARQLPFVNHDAGTVVEGNLLDELARATVPHYVNAATDTIVGVGKIGDAILTGDNTQDGAALLGSSPQLDFDTVRIFLHENDTIAIDVDTVGFSRAGEILDMPVISVFEQGSILSENLIGFNALAQSSLVEAEAALGETEAGAFLNFTAPADGYYDVVVSAANLFGTTALVVSELATATALNGQTLSMETEGFQAILEFTTDPDLSTSNQAVFLEDGDAPERIAEKIADAVNIVFPNRVATIVQGNTVSLSNRNDANNFVNAIPSSFFGEITPVFRGVDFGEYALTIRPEDYSPGAAPFRDVLMVDYQFGVGDVNRVSDQGQLIISGNFISDSAGFGVNATNGDRDQALANTNLGVLGRATPGTGDLTADGLPRPGSPRLLRNQNEDGLIPGAVISNNVITNSGTGGIAFGGDVNADGTYASPVLFGRIVNNTIVGDGTTDGITISGGSSPTVLNNIITGFQNGILTTGNQFGEVVVGGNAFQSNTVDSTLPLAATSFVIPTTTPLFEDPNRGIYIPAAGSQVIDSSFASLPERTEFFETVKEPSGIAPSPIIAPITDAYGQQRVDDITVTTPGGVGSNVFIDRGALDRADDVRPVAILTGPQDAVGFPVPGGDQDIDESFVRLSQGVVEFFEVQLLDESGSGIDEDSVTARNVLLTENGQALTPGIDYVFGYSSNSRSIRLTPLSGLWRPDAVYEITLNNRDRLSLTLPSGSGINDGDQVIIEDTSGQTQTFEFDSGFSVTVPQTSTLTINGTNADFVDGQTLTIEAPGGNMLSLEIDLGDGVAGGNVAVDLSSAGTIGEVRDAFLTALEGNTPGVTPAVSVAEFLELNPVTIGSDQLQLGTVTGHTISGSVAGADLTGVISGIVDGDTFTYTAGAETVTFEFTSDGILADMSNVPISIAATDTPDQIADQIVAAVAPENLGLIGAQSIGDGVVLLGGDPADSIDVAASALTLSGTAGVSDGAIGVSFLPTSQFTAASSAATLQGAILQSSLAVETFAAGGGTLLVSGAASITGSLGSQVVGDLGVPVPAITDLAGNTLRETRVNEETRFTIIMPDVSFDFGDAGDSLVSYPTLLADNGARHTIGASRLPRLGTHLDAEDDGQPGPGDSDDAPTGFTLSETGGAFSVSEETPNSSRVRSFGNPGTGGQTLTINVEGDETTFELVESTSNPASGNIPIALVTDDTAETITDKLINAIRGNVPEIGSALQLDVDESDPNSFTITAIDDEDGVAVGTFSRDGIDYNVFAVPGSGPVLGPDDVLGFLNPADPAGTNLAVTVAGAGLLDAWVDFDRSGTFDADEQLLTNTPVVDGLNILTVITPSDAIGSSDRVDTWARFRVSAGGNTLPTGVAVGGEVEDYQVSVVNEPSPIPVDDSYSVDEDETLVVDSTSPNRLLDNDINVNTTLLPTRLLVTTEPQFGTLTITDEMTGEFTYTPFEGVTGPTVGFDGTDTFVYRLLTQGNDSDAGSSGIRFATVTINIIGENDPPSFDVQTTVDLLEDSAPATVANVVTNALPGPENAPDELENQTLSFRIDLSRSVVPAGLMSAAPDVSMTAEDGSVTFFPADDAVGTATYVIVATDDDPSNPMSADATITVNVRPVNDPPIFDPSVAGTGETANPDDAYSVGRVEVDGVIVEAPITYTLREDNSQPGNVHPPYFIALSTDTTAPGYQRIGLLDVFLVGPPNEADSSPGGSQTLVLADFPETTNRGGTLTPVTVDGVLTGLNYVPPQDFNNAIGGTDSFIYTVGDQSPGGGETFDPETGMFVDNQQTQTNRVEFNLNPVNDRPEFTTTTDRIEVREDSSALNFPGYAININAGPPQTAFDEVDFNDGQNVIFSVTSLGFSEDQSELFFTEFPTVSPDGRLRFQAAPDVFGEFDFEIVATDDGPGNATRGDLISSLPVTLTIDVQPVNDPPQVDAAADPLSFELFEDGTIDILINGDGASRGLLDVFRPGPPNESEDIDPGGNQSVSLGTPVPAASAEGGSLTPITEDGEITRLRYVPRADFTGTDSFIYSVTDDGVTVDVNSGGASRPDPRIASNTVSLNVLPVNDAPQFSGADDVVVDEDAGVVDINAWASNVLAGPVTAVDELGGSTGQQIDFIITQVGGDTGLFSSAPAAVISGSQANLNFTTASDASGSATFQVQLRDDGPSDATIGDVNTSEVQTFTITINAVNDPPSFTPAGDVTVNEDSGPYNESWATDVSPGPSDEETQSVRFDVNVPVESEGLFQVLPTISDEGVLRFTPANNANGTADLSVTAIDSEGGTAESVTLRIVINAVNDPPVASSDTFTNEITSDRPLIGSSLLNGETFDADQAVNEDAVLVIATSDLLANDIDADLDPDLNETVDEVLTIVMPSQSFSVSGARVTYDESTGIITYDPTESLSAQSLAPGESLVDTFSYSLRDSAGAVSTSTVVSINVAGVNDAPRLEADAPQFNPDGPTVFNPLVNDSDVDGTIDPFTIVISSLPARGAISTAPDGTMTYTPFGEFTGDDEFQYTVADNLGDRSEPATVTISANAAPIARDDQDSGFLDESFVIDVASNDEDPDGSLDLTGIVIVDDPVRGQAVPLGDGTIRYIPDPGFLGFDSFQYTITDNLGRASTPADVEVRVVASRLQNPDENFDVNGSGEVSAIDALLVINLLFRSGNVSGIPVGPDDRGPNFYDVDGNQIITANDAFRVINELNRRTSNGGTPQGEAAPGVDAAITLLAPPASSGVADVSLPNRSAETKDVDIDPIASITRQPIGQIAAESAGLPTAIDIIAQERETDRDEEEALWALDAAMADLI